jgi:hypothetical protein
MKVRGQGVMLLSSFSFYFAAQFAPYVVSKSHQDAV